MCTFPMSSFNRAGGVSQAGSLAPDASSLALQDRPVLVQRPRRVRKGTMQSRASKCDIIHPAPDAGQLTPGGAYSYPYTSSEAVSRRLADFAFMLRDYRFAASVYDSIRKDYGSDKAFRYQAGATVRALLRYLWIETSIINLLTEFVTCNATNNRRWLGFLSS